jgi:hypothetical protein
MKRELRREFFRIVEAKFALGIHDDANSGFKIITEADLFGVLKSIRGLRMLPNTYQISIPQGTVVHPWGPEIKFQFQYVTANQGNWLQGSTGDPAIINTVQTAITNAFKNLISSAYVTHIDDDIYEVAITETP